MSTPLSTTWKKREWMLLDKIITVSNLTREIVISKYNIDPDKVETVYNAVEPLHHSELDIPEQGLMMTRSSPSWVA
ncbi:MAG: glycosyltransferase family 4 protein [Marinilabiliales bacterium]|nr:glycosyltransferase family 4 protein [Marinilabiliales bacterium]